MLPVPFVTCSFFFHEEWLFVSRNMTVPSRLLLSEKEYSRRVLFNPFGTIGLTTAIFLLLDSPVLLALFYMGQPP